MEAMPREIFVNPDDKAVIMTRALINTFPDAPEAFREADDRYCFSKTQWRIWRC